MLFRSLIAQPIAPRNSVVRMLIQAVAGLDDCRRATFGRDGVAAHRIDLGNDGDAEAGEGVSHGDRRAQACTASTHHQDVAGERVHDALNMGDYVAGPAGVKTRPREM